MENTSAGDAFGGRSLSHFTVELDVYSGPYEWLLALVLKEEVEIFEVPLSDLVDLYLEARDPLAANTLERDTDFADSASALVLLKSRTLAPLFEPEHAEEPVSPEDLAKRLSEYLKVRRGAEFLKERLQKRAGRYPSGHELKARPGKLRLERDRLALAAKRTFSRLSEPPVEHLGPITLTVQQLADLIRNALLKGSVRFEEVTRGMDRLHRAVAFAAALSLANEGDVRLLQNEPLGPLTLKSAR